MGKPIYYYDGPEDFDTDTHVATSVAVGVEEVGVAMQTRTRVIPGTLLSLSFDFTITDAAETVPFDKYIQHRTFDEPINYIGIQASARNNPVYVSIRDITYNQFDGTTWVPSAMWVARAGQGTVYFRIPTKQSYRIAVMIDPPSGYALVNSSYKDRAMLVAGYLPDERERIVSDG